MFVRLVNKSVLLHALLFSFFLCLCGLIAVALGKDLDFDLANYHYYNAYALLHNLLDENYWPPSYLHVFLNPVPDLLSYALINSFPAKITVFASGAIVGINLCLLFLIARAFVDNYFYPKVFAVFIAFFGIFAPISWPSIGNFKNDHLVASFILFFVLLQIKFWQQYQLSQKLQYALLSFSALLLGFGAGLKLTAMLFVLSAAFTLLCMPIKWSVKIKILLTAVLITGVGFILSSGYWMYALWQEYQNPIFPFYNAIFHSTKFPFYNINFPEHLPGSLMKSLFFPFYFSFYGTYTDGPFRDFRFLVLYFLSLILFLKWLKQGPMRVCLSERWLVLYFLFCYFTAVFAIGGIRYMMAIEMLAPLIIYLFARWIIKSKEHWALTIIIYIFLFCTMIPAHVGTRSKIFYSPDYFDVKLPSIVSSSSKALVLMPYSIFARSNDPRPQTYLIPFFPSSWRFVGMPFHQGQYVAPEATVIKKIQDRIDTASEIYALTIESSMVELIKAAENFNLRPSGVCEKIYSERQRVNQNDVLLCPMRRE